MLLYRTNKKPSTIEPNNDSGSHHESAETASRKKFSERKKMISLSILVVTIGFVVSTTPSAIIMGFFIKDMYMTKTGKLIVWVFDALLFTYHSFKFEIIFIFNYQFNREMNTFLEECCSRRRISSSRKQASVKSRKTVQTVSGSDIISL